MENCTRKWLFSVNIYFWINSRAGKKLFLGGKVFRFCSF